MAVGALAIAGFGLQAGGSLLSGIFGSQAEKRAAAARAKVLYRRAAEADVQAFETRREGHAVAGFKENEMRAAVGTITAGTAGRGVVVGTGSAAVISAQTEVLGRIDSIAIRYNAERKARVSEREAANLRFAAAEGIEAGGNLATARAVGAGFDAAGSLLQLGKGFRGFGKD